MPNFTDQNIRTLAYKFWQNRGSPFNKHPEEDWVESERILTMDAGTSVQAPGESFDPSSWDPDHSFSIGPSNEYQYKISFDAECDKLRWIDNFRVLGDLDVEIFRDFHKCYPKSYGNFLVSFKTGSVAQNRGEIEANCFYLDTGEIASYAKECLFDALNDAINPFAPMHRTGSNYAPYMYGATNPSDAYILIPYRITNDSVETIWCYGLIYDCTTGLWLNQGWQRMKANATPRPENSDRIVWAMFERK